MSVQRFVHRCSQQLFMYTQGADNQQTDISIQWDISAIKGIPAVLYNMDKSQIHCAK